MELRPESSNEYFTTDADSVVLRTFSDQGVKWYVKVGSTQMLPIPVEHQMYKELEHDYWQLMCAQVERFGRSA